MNICILYLSTNLYCDHFSYSQSYNIVGTGSSSKQFQVFSKIIIYKYKKIIKNRAEGMAQDLHSTWLANVRPWVQTLVLPKKKILPRKEKHNNNNEYTYCIFGVIPSSSTIFTPPMWAVAHVSVIFWCKTS
jgi:hypothetical protein